MRRDADSDLALVVWNESRERQLVCRILAATGIRVYPFASLDALPEKRLSVVVIDLDRDADTTATRNLLTKLSEQDPPPTTLLVSSSRDREGLIEILSDSNFTNLIARNTALQAHEVSITVNKLLSDDIFGMEKYLSWGIRQHTEKMTSSEVRYDALTNMEAFLRNLGCNRRLTSLGQTAGEELLMNALYNAAVDEEGRKRYASWPRTRPVTLEPDEEIIFRYASDGQRLALSVTDPFGQLHRQDVLRYLRKCLRRGADQVDTKEGGAGLGLYQILQSVNSLVVNVAPKKQTEMIGLIDISGSYRDFAKQPKSLHLFFRKESESN